MHLYAHSHQHSWHLSLLGLNALGGAAPTLFSFVSLSVGSGTKGHTGCCSEKKWNLRPPSRDHQDCEWRWLPFIIDIYIWVCANVDVVERERERGGCSQDWSLCRSFAFDCLQMFQLSSDLCFIICFSPFSSYLNLSFPRLSAWCTIEAFNHCTWLTEFGHVPGATSPMGWTNQIIFSIVIMYTF